MAKALFANNIKTPFVSLNAGDTTLAVNDDSGFPIITGSDFFYLTLFNLNGSVEENIEIVKVTAKVTTNVYTIERGQDGTADIAHSSTLDNYAGLRLTAGIASRFVQSDDGTINNDNWSGTDLAINNGGTGASTAQAAINNLVGGTVTNGLFLRGNGTNAVMASIQASDVPTLNQNTTGTAANVTGVVAIANGGTGSSTQAGALTAICGTAVTGTYPRGNGVNVVMSAIQASDIPTLNQNTTGTAANVTGVVAIANGGTGQSNATEAFDALAPTTTLGDIIYRNANDNVRLAGNTTTTKQFLSQTGTGTVSAAPAWAALVNGDIPTALTGKTYNGLTLTAAATGFTIAGGTTSKTLTVNNTLTLAGTDSSTLNIGAGGTLGSAAFTASTAYEPAFATLSNTKGGTGQNSSAWTGIPKVVSGTWSVATAGTDYLAPSAIGTTVQAYDAQLADIAALTPTDNTFIVGNGTNFVSEDAATARTSLGLGTLATQAASSVAITGGSIDGTTIGGSTPAAGTFTSINASQPSVISVNSSSNAFRITQTGSGNALVVEDSTNPDATPFVIGNDGRTYIGTQPGTVPSAGYTNNLIVAGQDNNVTGISIFDYATTSTPRMTFLYSPSGTVGVTAAVSNGTSVGELRFLGNNGTSFIRAAAIAAGVDGTPGTNDMPGRLVFSTTAGGASTPTERMRIDSAGNIGINMQTTAAAGFNFIEQKVNATNGGGYRLFNSGLTVEALRIFTDGAGSGTNIHTYAAIPMIFGTNATERMRIDSSGNVGIGTSSPATKLDVNGTITATGWSGGGIVTETASQTLTNKTLTDPAIIGTILEDVFTQTTSSSTLTIDPSNGSIQQITLGQSASSVSLTNFVAGEGITVMIADGTAFTITWGTSVTWVGGSAPTLTTTGFTVIEFWKVGSIVYGAIVGDVA